MQSIRRLAHKVRNGWQTVRKGLLYSALHEIDFNSGLGDSAFLLHGLVISAKPRVVVEIGSARGRSTCFMGMALKNNGSGRLYAIDPHTRTTWNDLDSSDTFEFLKSNVNKLGLQQYVEILRNTSEEIARNWDRTIDILFIDGDHSYEGVKRDWGLFSPFVQPFGSVIFHDTLWDLKPDPRYNRPDMGVPRFVDELREQGYPIITLDRDFGVSLVQPTLGGTPLQSRAHTR